MPPFRVYRSTLRTARVCDALFASPEMEQPSTVHDPAVHVLYLYLYLYLHVCHNRPQAPVPRDPPPFPAAAAGAHLARTSLPGPRAAATRRRRRRARRTAVPAEVPARCCSACVLVRAPHAEHVHSTHRCPPHANRQQEKPQTGVHRTSFSGTYPAGSCVVRRWSEQAGHVRERARPPPPPLPRPRWRA